MFLSSSTRARYIWRDILCVREKKKQSECILVCCERQTGKEKFPQLYAPGAWRYRDIKKKWIEKSCQELNARPREIDGFELKISNASIDREVAPLSPKLPCIPRWITLWGRSCTTLKGMIKKRVFAPNKSPLLPNKLIYVPLSMCLSYTDYIPPYRVYSFRSNEAILNCKIDRIINRTRWVTWILFAHVNSKIISDYDY